MSKYDIQDAVMLKECMKQIALVRAKYPTMYMPTDIEYEIKEAAEFIEAMVEKKV